MPDDSVSPDTPGSAAPDDEEAPTVVGVGASAGGLAALKTFFAEVPADSGVVWVVVVHLSPEHESHLAELLQPHVRMPIQQVAETVPLETDRVYVIPPNANLSAIDTHLRLSDLEEHRRERAPIDHFFRTLARTHDGHSVGVILTGTGSDGTLGIREIKEKGGLTVVQDPGEAEYDGMPQSAIATGVVDQVLPLAEIPQAVLGFAGTHPRVTGSQDEADEPAEVDEAEERQLLQKVFAEIRSRTGRDFGRYKRSTILRRIARRMQIRRIEELDQYLELLRGEADEVRALADDLLITVTSFFRDPEVFEALEKEVIPGLMEGRGPDETVRVWSVGCATGEEAYSLAILLMEAAARQDAPPRIQVFASDLHDTSLKKARDGFYPGDITTDVAPARLKRFFTEEDGGYRIRPEVRDVIVFSPHDLLGDPPFSRVDLISCRNVLIYLDREVQRDVADLFHYALRGDGYLVLGGSETVETRELFHVQDKKHCIYRRRNVPGPEPRLPVFPMARGRRATGEGGAVEVEPQAYGELHERIVERFGPPSMLVSPDDRVVHLSEHAGRYLVHSGGEPTTNAFMVVREELRIELRSALDQARKRQAPVQTQPRTVRFNGESADVVMDVRPSLDPEQVGYAVVLFAEREPGAAGVTEAAAAEGAPNGPGSGSGGASAEARAAELEAELQQSRDRLESVIEQYETTEEELRASNEELQSSNEELRSTMEELETSKEELQSINEELQTLNQENRHKVEELSQVSADLQNLMSATGIATLFLDLEGRIMRYTPPVAELFNVRPADRGRPVADLTHRLEYDELVQDAARVLEQLTPVEREIRDVEDRWYLTRLLPYRSREDEVEGVVVTFVDITARKHAEMELERARHYAESIVETLHEPLLVLEPDLRVRTANPAFFEHFEVREDETIGRLIYDLGNSQWDIPELRTLLEDVLPDSEIFNDYEVRHQFEDIGERVMLLNARRLDHVQLILLGIRDITERIRSEETLRESEARFRVVADLVPDFLWQADPMGRCVWGNQRWMEYTGQTPDEATDHGWTETIHSEDRAAALEAYEAAIQAGKPYQHEYRVRRADGAYRWFLVRAVPVRDDEGEVREWIGSDTDVHEHHEIMDTLETRVAERTREVRDLAETLSVAEQEERQRLSHLLHDDLQQLLYGIQMKVSLARDHAQREDLEGVVKQTERSLELLDDAITRTRQLTVDLNPPILEGEGLVGAIEWLRTQMRDLHGLTVEIHANAEIDVRPPDLRILLFQITRELLFNVAKHAETDRAVVRVAGEDGRVRIEVADEGKGFDLGVLDSGVPRRGGLGLFSARERLRMRGGELEIESVPGNGTRVVAYAPLASGS
ncbi:MAG: chemotaxis protein CheB [Gemmatimonadota bacterium]